MPCGDGREIVEQQRIPRQVSTVNKVRSRHNFPADHRTDSYVSVSASFVGSLLDTNLYCVE
ncbi:MAG: hypothetical protein M0Q92_03545 [Methanoregula sp.]|nr:hypothetical protein [Methanoregula sp.]